MNALWDELAGESQTLLWAAVTIGIAVLVGLAAYVALFWALRRIERRTGTGTDDVFIERCRAPSRLLLPLIAVSFVLPGVALPFRLAGIVERSVALALIAGVAWLAIQLVSAVTEVILTRHAGEATDNLLARRVETRVKVLRRIVVAVIGILAMAAMLVTFEPVRALGASILASAGIAGIVVGLAARPAISNLLAGIQIAITEPIRLDDVVVVEGEFGRVEEITLTYVIVRTWDLRRLIVPISYFLERSFQNWTRVEAELLGTVFLQVDYGVPVPAVRQELLRILQESSRWDGKVWALHVTDATERAVQLRALMSAADSATLWELRCEVRERLIEFLQRSHPETLPQLRPNLRELAGMDRAAAESKAGDGRPSLSPAEQRDPARPGPEGNETPAYPRS